MNVGIVYIVDDDAAVRDALSLVLSLRHVRARAFDSGPALLAALRRDARGCVLSDLKMPGMDGLELFEALRGRGCTLPVVLLTAHGDVTTARRALKAGVFDFLEKPFDHRVLVEVLQEALAECERRRASGMEAPAAGGAERLTPREQEVRELLVRGLQLREIAQVLDISPRTVEVYKARVMEKLRCRSIAELVRRHGIVPDARAREQRRG